MFVEAICVLLVSMIIGICVSVFTPNVDGSFGIATTHSESQDIQDFNMNQFYKLLRLSGVLLVVMIVQSICSGLEYALREQAAERMLARMRCKAFDMLLQQEVISRLLETYFFLC
jgi:ABC-type transport system involved in cytochrome bd biosynthesis fused ATPase/permease subunit